MTGKVAMHLRHENLVATCRIHCCWYVYRNLAFLGDRTRSCIATRRTHSCSDMCRKHACSDKVAFIVLFQKTFILLPRRVLLVWTPHPSGNASLGSYFPLKILAFKTTTLPLGIFNDPWWWGCGYFLEPHIRWIRSTATCRVAGYSAVKPLIPFQGYKYPRTTQWFCYSLPLVRPWDPSHENKSSRPKPMSPIYPKWQASASFVWSVLY